MENVPSARRFPFRAALGLSLAAGALRCIDLMLFTDAATGFALRGPVWLRYAIAAAAVLGLRWAAAYLPPAAAADHRPDRLLAAMLLAAGIFSLLAAGPSLPMKLAACAAALGFVLLAWQAGRRTGGGSALAGLLPVPWLLGIAAERALIAPAAVTRPDAVLRVLSIVAALAFFTALLRRLYVPAQPAPVMCFTAGFACFLFCTCVELPQTLWALAGGTAQLRQMPAVAALACLGLAGARCARRAAGS